MKVILSQLMFRGSKGTAKGTAKETAFTGLGWTLNCTERITANAQNTVPKRALKGRSSHICVSRVGIPLGNPAFIVGERIEEQRAFEEEAYDLLFGKTVLKGEEIRWVTDGTVVKTTFSCSEAEFDFLSIEEKCRVTLYPLAAHYEPSDDDTAEFRKKYLAGTATKVEALRYSDAFYYGRVVDNDAVELILGCSEAECTPPEAETPFDSAPTPNTTEKHILPWLSAETASIPNDFSVESALKGKYRLPFEWGEVADKEGNTYSFKEDVLDLSFLGEYVDNPSYRQAVRQLCGVFGAVARREKLTADTEDALGKLLRSPAFSTAQNLMLVGEPGTGKTMLARALGATFGLPVAVLRLSTHSETDEMTTQVVATDEGFKTLMSQLYWYTQYGGIFVFDDVSNADANQFFSVVGGLLEAPFNYNVNQRPVHRSALSFMVGTANIGTVGSVAMNEALLTRFSSHLLVNPLSDEDFKKAILTRAIALTGHVPPEKEGQKLINWVFSVYKKTLSTVKSIDLELAGKLITLRAAVALAEKIFCALADGFEFDSTVEAQTTMSGILYTAGNPEVNKAVSDAIANLPKLLKK